MTNDGIFVGGGRSIPLSNTNLPVNGFAFNEGIKWLVGIKEKDIETIADKWATFQSENFGQSTQPLYVILNHEGKLMTHPVGYTPDAKKYEDWLNCGLKAYTSNQ
ncbi:hypothetical protein EON78_04050 [bacterium]|nr:MAG: hypothetical protein EON78_04050 [bacterium]